VAGTACRLWPPEEMREGSAYGYPFTWGSSTPNASGLQVIAPRPVESFLGDPGPSWRWRKDVHSKETRSPYARGEAGVTRIASTDPSHRWFQRRLDAPSAFRSMLAHVGPGCQGHRTSKGERA
jgi:hypothetical protein